MRYFTQISVKTVNGTRVFSFKHQWVGIYRPAQSPQHINSVCFKRPTNLINNVGLISRAK